MYIPTMFYNLGGCVRAIPTGSVIPPGVTLGTVTDGTDSWNYIEVEQGYHTYIEFDFGTTEEAKLVLIGEGGFSTTGSAEPGASQYDLGGGAGGDVIIQDVALQPGAYYMSASANTEGYPNGNGGDAAFRNDFSDSQDNRVFIAYGGGNSDSTLDGGDGGDNTSYQGGIGVVNAGAKTGGGGAGSTMSGLSGIQQPGIGNASIGGDGGSGSIVTSPFLNAVGYSIVGSGGPGMGTVNTPTPVSFNLKGHQTGDANQWGLGGSWNTNRTRNTPNQSRAFLFIPISPNCPEEWPLIFSDTNACTASVSDVFYTAANNGIELGNTLFTDFGLTQTTASLFRTSGSNEYFSTNAFGEIITSGSNCFVTWTLNYSDTNACTSSISTDFYTREGTTLSVGNTLYTDASLTQTTASLFRTSGSNEYFETDTSGEITSSGSVCPIIFTSWSLNYNDTDVCTSSTSADFYTSIGTTLSVGNILYTDIGLTQTTASLFQSSGSNMYFNTDSSGEILTSGSNCVDTWNLTYSNGNVCTSSLSTDFYTTQGIPLAVGNILYTDLGLSQTTASLFKTPSSNLYFETDTNGEILTSGSICPDFCETWNFNGGPSTDNTGSATLCGTTSSVDFFVPPNTTVTKCVQVGTTRNLSGADSQIVYVANGCVSQWELFYNETNACTSSLSATFYTTGSTELTVGNILYTNSTRSQTTASLFRTSGSSLYFTTDTNGEILTSGSACVSNCESWNFIGGPDVGTGDFTGSYIPCGQTGSVDFAVPPSTTVNQCLQSGSVKNLTGAGSSFQYVSTC